MMRFRELTLGSGGTVSQIVKGDFELREFKVGDSGRAVMFVGIRHGHNIQQGEHWEKPVCIPFGAVTLALPGDWACTRCGYTVEAAIDEFVECERPPGDSRQMTFSDHRPATYSPEEIEALVKGAQG